MMKTDGSNLFGKYLLIFQANFAFFDIQPTQSQKQAAPVEEEEQPLLSAV
jgi:hypothetical protein